MKTNEKGITLISVIVIIILLLIIGSVVVYNGQDSIKQAATVEKIKELEIIQSKVNVIYEEQIKSNPQKEEYASLGESLDNVQEDLLVEALQDEDRAGFRYFSKEDLEQIQLENMNQDVLINFETRKVVSLYGIEIDGTKYYSLYEMPNYVEKNIEYIDKNNKAPTFDANIIAKEDMWIVKIVNINYNSNVKDGQISYKLQDSQNWILANDTSFKVYTPGIYDIMLQDSAGNSTIIQKEIKYEIKTYEYTKDGILAYYDAENNTKKGHSNTTSIWKDLSGNNNDAELFDFDYTTQSGWNEKSLKLDGIDDVIKMNVKLQAKSSLSMELIFKDYNYSQTSIIYSDKGWNAFSAHTYNNDGSIYIGGNYNANSQNRFSPSEINYKIPLEKTISLVYTYDEQTKTAAVYINGVKKAGKQYTIGGEAIENFTIYANKAYSRISIYNKSLNEQEIKNNYEIDKYRFGIE